MGKAIHWTHRKELQQFTDAYQSMFAPLDTMTVAQLERLKVACEACSQSNCCWATYRAAQAILPDVKYYLRLAAVAAPAAEEEKHG